MQLKLSDQISGYLNEQLMIPDYQLSNMDKDIIHTKGIAKFIFTQVTRSSFRRTALDSETIKDIESKINHQITHNHPISFSIPFGAYKNWHLNSFPEPDWAEVFNINYMVKFAVPILSSYEPGVKLQYSYSADVMDVVSNIPKESTERYISVFNKLLALFQVKVPHNLYLKTVSINDFYTREEQLLELQKNYEFNRSNWSQKYPEEIRQKKINSARHNLMLNGVQDLRTLSNEELEARYLDAAMWCDALDSLKRRREFNKGSTNIQIVFVRGPCLSLHLGSCETSAFHAWAGTGVLEQRGTRFLPRILSHASLTSLEAQQEIQSINVETLFRELSNNFIFVLVTKALDQKQG